MGYDVADTGQPIDILLRVWPFSGEAPLPADFGTNYDNYCFQVTDRFLKCSLNLPDCVGTHYYTFEWYQGAETAFESGYSIPATCTYNLGCSSYSTYEFATASHFVPTTVAPTATLTANPASITQGDSSTLTWTSTNATSCTGTTFSTGSGSPVSGSTSVSPTITTTYTVTCTGPGGSASDTATVTVTSNPPPPPPSSGPYGPYCGDGAVNQAWEQCDGGSSCSDKCQLGNQCANLVLARVNVTNVQSSATKPSNMTSNLFIGGSATANKIPQGKWFALFYNGTYYNDPDIGGYENVPGLAIERAQGKLRALMYGSYTGSNSDPAFNEHAEGNVETWQATITGQTNDTTGQNKYENPSDGVKELKAGQDEFWLSGGKSYFWTSVNAADDAFWTNYTNTAPSCTPPPPPPPSCTLSANPSTINQGDSSILHWVTSNATSISINHGVGVVTPVASGYKSVSPSSTTTYTATAVGANGTATCKTTVTVTPPPPPNFFTVKATKIVCDAESDLPNWSSTANNITGTTAADYVASHPGCYLAPNWGFEWATGNQPNPGDNQLSGGSGWTAFGPTDANGLTATSVNVNSISNGNVWIRERWKSGYIPFTGVSGSNVSAEMYCSTDVKYYDNYELIKNPIAGYTYYCVAWNVPVPAPPTPSCTLSANPTSLTTPGQTTLSWTSANATSASINQGVGSVTPVSAGSVSANVSTTTTYTMTVTGPNGTATCQAPVTITPAGPSCTLSLNSSEITTGQSVILSWISSGTTSGFINNNVGTTSPVSSGSTTVFPPSSTTYIGTFTGSTGTTTCSVPITVRTGPNDCDRGLCPGGLNQPNVSMFRQPGEQPLAFISLSQIPYTGFEAGPVLTMIFWLAIGLLSAMIAYFIVGKGGMRSFLVYVLGGVAGVPIQKTESERREEEHTPDYGRSYPELRHEEESARAYENAAAPQVPTLEPTVHISAPPMPRSYVIGSSHTDTKLAGSFASTETPDISALLESRAHAAGVLMSPEAVALAAALSGDRAEVLRIFGDILNEAVKTIPREDGWIMLTADRLRELSAKPRWDVPATSYAAPAETAPGSIDESAASAFAGAILSGDRDSAFSIIRSLEHDGMKPTALMTMTATVLDTLYRARRMDHPAPDASLADKASHVSDEQLAKLVEVFTHALDHVYTSPFTGVKLALAQAFEVIG